MKKYKINENQYNALNELSGYINDQNKHYNIMEVQEVHTFDEETGAYIGVSERWLYIKCLSSFIIEINKLKRVFISLGAKFKFNVPIEGGVVADLEELIK